MPRNYDIAELRRLDVAHHLPAQADWKEIENLGGSRIITTQLPKASDGLRVQPITG